MSIFRRIIGILMLIVAYAGTSLFFAYSPAIYFFFIVLGITLNARRGAVEAG